MLTDENLSELRAFFDDFASTSKTIVGARIGDNIKKKFPELNVKAEYGSLQKLIELHFKDLLELSGMHGNDKEYAFLNQISNTPDKSAFPNVEVENKKISSNVTNIQIENFNTQNHPLSDAAFRQAIKNAIDTMTLEQLRQLALPAGILLDAINNPRTM
jgi:hypothetical protein